MLTLLNLGAENVLADRVEDELTAADVDRVIAALDEKLTAHETLRVYAEVHRLSGVTPQAVWRQIETSITRLSVVSRVERAALVTDLEWLRRVAAAPNPFLRGMEVRAFSLSEQHLAQSWIQG